MELLRTRSRYPKGKKNSPCSLHLTQGRRKGEYYMWRSMTALLIRSRSPGIKRDTLQWVSEKSLPAAVLPPAILQVLFKGSILIFRRKKMVLLSSGLHKVGVKQRSFTGWDFESWINEKVFFFVFPFLFFFIFIFYPSRASPDLVYWSQNKESNFYDLPDFSLQIFFCGLHYQFLVCN